MEQEMAKSQPMTDYQSYVIKRQVEDYWRADEKVQLILCSAPRISRHFF